MRMQEIVGNYGEEYVLRQLAEECAELTHAALKLIRARNGETPVSDAEAKIGLMEEIADVRVMIQALYAGALSMTERSGIRQICRQKKARMYERMLDDAKKGHREGE